MMAAFYFSRHVASRSFLTTIAIDASSASAHGTQLCR